MRPSGRAQLSWAQRTSVREPQLEHEMHSPACRVASSVFAVRKNGETNLHHVAHGKRDIAGGFHDGMRHGFEFAFRHVGVRVAHAYGGDGVA